MCPKIVTRLNLEPEIAVYMSARAKRVKATDAKKYILGYTVSNDVTAFETIYKTSFPALYGKSFDTFGILGPRINTDIDPTNATLRGAPEDFGFVDTVEGGMKESSSSARCGSLRMRAGARCTARISAPCCRCTCTTTTKASRCAPSTASTTQSSSATWTRTWRQSGTSRERPTRTWRLRTTS